MQASKRILVFSFAYYPIEGGAEIALRKITEKLENITFDIVTFCFNKKEHCAIEHNKNITIHRISVTTRLLFPFIAARYAKKLHKRKEFTHIWAIMANYAGFAALFFKKKNMDIPLLLTLQEGDPISYIKRKVWFVYPWFKQIFIYANKIQTISLYLKDFAISMGHKNKISIIANGVDDSFFNKEIIWPRHIKDAPILITTSRLVKKNAIDNIISTVSLLPSHIKLYILGEGNERDSLENLSAGLMLQEKVKFFGNVQYEKLPQYLSRADIYIRPSRSEGFGSSFIEAMANGLPVIGTDVGGISDFLKDKETGFICKVDNPENITEIIKYILLPRNQAEVKKILIRAKTLIEENYKWSSIALKVEQLFL